MKTRLMKLCIIDDVKKVLDGMTQNIDWSEHGIEVVGTALNGLDGLDLIHAYKPEIIITDIRMPFMDGLALTTEALKFHPWCKVILISGYTDFEYAREAIRIGAFDFITKPFALQEVVQVVNRAKDELEVQIALRHNIQLMEQQLQESLPILRQEYFNLLLQHGTSRVEAQKRWEFLQADVSPENLWLLAVELDGMLDNPDKMSIHEVELIRFSLQNILEETISTYTKGMVNRDHQGRIVVVFNCANHDLAEKIGEECREHIERYTKVTASIGLSESVQHASDLPVAYKQAVRALAQRFYLGGNMVFSYNSIGDTRKKHVDYYVDQDHEFYLCFRSGNVEMAERQLELIFEEISGLAPLPFPEYLSFMLLEVMYRCLRILLEEIPQSDTGELEEMVHQHAINKTKNLTILKQVLMRICERGCDLLQAKRVSDTEQMIFESAQYIRDHVQEKLTMQHCAQRVHLSPSYFSNLFSKIIGMTFTQFLIQEKMEKAKEMLVSGERVQDVALYLGYQERRYFTDVFKKYSGYSPVDFKKMYEKD